MVASCVFHLTRSENSQVGPHDSDEDEDDHEYLHESDDGEEGQGAAILETTWVAKSTKMLRGGEFNGSRIVPSIARFGKPATSIRMFPTFLPRGLQLSTKLVGR